MPHSPDCRGCLDCDVEMRAASAAFSRGDYVTYCLWLKKQDVLRTASSRGELRTNIHYPEKTMRNNTYDAPDPYKADIAKLRAEMSTSESRFEDQYRAARIREFAAEGTDVVRLRAAHASRATRASLRQFEPPDPYAEGIKALRAEGGR